MGAGEFSSNHFVRILESLSSSCFGNQLLNKINSVQEGVKFKVIQSSKRIKRNTKSLFSTLSSTLILRINSPQTGGRRHTFCFKVYFSQKWNNPYVTFQTKLSFVISVFNIQCRSVLCYLFVEHSTDRSRYFAWASILRLYFAEQRRSCRYPV